MYESEKHRIAMFKDSIHKFFAEHPELSQGKNASIHSVRSRLKDPDHLKDKLRRKSKSTPVRPKNFFERVTDLAGVRVLLLHQDLFPRVHKVIMDEFKRGTWHAPEAPKAFTWDPDSEAYFKTLGLKTELRDSHYTSIHYLARPIADSPICCEIQVRTLFEEVWGEIDHKINYPHESKSKVIREQLRVLAKFVGAGSRLAVSIIRANEEFFVQQTDRKGLIRGEDEKQRKNKKS